MPFELGRNHSLVGQSPQIEAVRRLIEKASRNHAPVLLLGETGTGKEVVARAVYNANPRGQFVPIDCGALVGTLLESELFGHVRGAFSGATENKKGLMELADGGTAFFDEIGDLPLEMQVKLLRLMQEHEFRPVGGLHWRKIEVRIIAATHRDLNAEIAAKRFREDLYYRLHVLTVHLPPLRERKDDIPLLVGHFIDLCRQEGMPEFCCGDDVMRALLSYGWPGNVRELKHCIDRMAALRSAAAVELEVKDLPTNLRNHQASLEMQDLSEVLDQHPFGDFVLPPKRSVISIADSEEYTIKNALRQTNGERAKAAAMLRIGRTTLYRKMKQYGIA